ncbi:MAG: ABC transporter ATP-binding protein [Bacillota bacterium]
MILIKNLNKKYNNEIIFKNFNLKINKNEITTIIGPSGSGKTTFLKILSGIDKNYNGDIIGIDKRLISYIFQTPRLLPWKTVYGNVLFVNDDNKKIESILKNVDLWDSRNLFPKELSGGMKQRVSIARAFNYPSNILLMDEGFKGLDYKLKNNLIKYFEKIWKKNKKTVINVTHNIDEALLISDRVIQFSDSPVRILNDIEINIKKEERFENEKLKDIKSEFIKENNGKNL